MDINNLYDEQRVLKMLIEFALIYSRATNRDIANDAAEYLSDNEIYRITTQWHPMEEAPKLPIQDIIIAIKCDDGRVGSGEGYWDSDYNYWVTATGEKIDDPVAWTHLPIYNPQTEEK